MAKPWPSIEGETYGATFLPMENGFAGSSVAEALIDPPVVLGMDSTIVDVCFNSQEVATKISAQHVATTASRTLIEITVNSEGDSDAAYVERLNAAYRGLERLIKVLDSIDDGSYQGDITG